MKTAFEIRNLLVDFSGKHVLQDINLDIRKNKITAIVGPSGCGKSTFLKMLNGLIDYEDNCNWKGEVIYSGRSIHSSQMKKQTLRKDVAMLFQNPGAFPFSIRKNFDIAYDEWNSAERIKKDNIYKSLLEKVSLWKEIEGNLSLDAMSLSGGQQQRLCLVRSLLTEPSTILLDEPCSSLDPISTGIIENLLVELSKSKTIVIVTHDLSQARRIADDIVVMWPIAGIGQIVENGDAQKIFADADTYIAQEYLQGRLPNIA